MGLGHQGYMPAMQDRCCLLRPPGTRGKPQNRNCPVPGWKHIVLRGRRLADAAAARGVGIYQSLGQTAVFTASLGILLLGIKGHGDIRYAKSFQLTIMILIQNIFGRPVFYLLCCKMLSDTGDPQPAGRCLGPVYFSQDVIFAQTDHVALGHHTGQSTGASNRPLPRPSIIDAMLLTHGRWQHNTSQVR